MEEKKESEGYQCRFAGEAVVREEGYVGSPLKREEREKGYQSRMRRLRGRRGK